MKGSDASNVHDEEVGDDEIEFSDDEAEAMYKRQLKRKYVSITPNPSFSLFFSCFKPCLRH
jgi:hypothetical protein